MGGVGRARVLAAEGRGPCRPPRTLLRRGLVPGPWGRRVGPGGAVGGHGERAGAVAVGKPVLVVVLVLLGVTVPQVPPAASAALVARRRRSQQLLVALVLRAAASARAPTASLLLCLLRRLFFGLFAAFPLHPPVLEPDLHLRAQAGCEARSPPSPSVPPSPLVPAPAPEGGSDWRTRELQGVQQTPEPGGGATEAETGTPSARTCTHALGLRSSSGTGTRLGISKCSLLSFRNKTSQLWPGDHLLQGGDTVVKMQIPGPHCNLLTQTCRRDTGTLPDVTPHPKGGKGAAGDAGGAGGSRGQR